MNICKNVFFVPSSRYWFRKILRRFFYMLWDSLPDTLLIVGSAALFVFIWYLCFIK